MSIDPTIDVVNQILQGGGVWEVGGTLNIDTVAGGKLTIGGVDVTAAITKLDPGQPAQVTFAPAAGAANVCQLTVTLKDSSGTPVTAPVDFDMLLSDAATGAGLTATTATGTVVAGASGADLGDYTAKKAKRVQCNAAGVYILQITDTGKTGFYPVVAIGGLKAFVGAQLVAGNYG